ncbi:hypothetical protein R3W88_026880 [Solanum pinnatisectum]|uniref:Glycosyl hydrolase family 32 C-terminal domain-containing protein n=1 Tax=Solanum pinnatisectum TaxID=50273 RepID=A0AAV9LEH2_9SOLN|nr:hypothetical protein R3W88_026880 [Solanum pinnatisectum]
MVLFMHFRPFMILARIKKKLWGWTNEYDVFPTDSINKNGSGIQAIPHKLWIDPKLEMLRKQKIELRNYKLNKGENVEVQGITPAQVDVEVTFSFSSLENAEEFDPSWADLYALAIRGLIMYKPSFVGYVDTNLTDKRLSLLSLTDHSVVESFGDGGKTCITSRVYPSLASYGDTNLFAFNNGTKTIKIETLDVWNMGKSKR